MSPAKLVGLALAGAVGYLVLRTRSSPNAVTATAPPGNQVFAQPDGGSAILATVEKGVTATVREDCARAGQVDADPDWYHVVFDRKDGGGRIDGFMRRAAFG